MTYLLDTNICIHLLNGDERLKEKVREIGIHALSISTTVLAELYFGAYNSKKVEANLKTIDTFSRHLTIYADSPESSKIFGKIKAVLKSQGRLIEDFDLLIASIALANHLTLITHNTAHFERIPGLSVKDWFASFSS